MDIEDQIKAAGADNFHASRRRTLKTQFRASTTTADRGVLARRARCCRAGGRGKLRPVVEVLIPQPLHLLTFCVLVLRNGFTVTGESARASPENFNAEIGRKIARQNAVEKIWPLMGFALREKLAHDRVSALKRALTDPQVRQQFAALTPSSASPSSGAPAGSGCRRLSISLSRLGLVDLAAIGGRGAGKTRTRLRLGLVGMGDARSRWLVSAPTSGDLRGTCFEGDSGLLNVIPKALIADYNKSLHEITLVNGRCSRGFRPANPNAFVGQFHGGWLDELAAWDYLGRIRGT